MNVQNWLATPKTYRADATAKWNVSNNCNVQFASLRRFIDVPPKQGRSRGPTFMKHVRTLMPLVVLTTATAAASCGNADDGSNPAQATTSELTEAVAFASPPPGKVIMPGGKIVDKACVFEVPDNATVTNEGDVVVNGKVTAHHEPCAAAQATAVAAPASAVSGKVQRPALNGWVENTWADASPGGFWKEIAADWTVPPAPTSNLNKIIYLFPSLTSTWGGSGEIIQPVLQYGGNGEFGGNYWVMSSWYVYPNGGHHSAVKNVFPGDQLHGYVLYNHSTGPKTQFYDIYSGDVTRGTSTLLSINTNGPFKSAQGGVLEVYGITTCAQLPPMGPEVFTNIYLYDQNFTQIHPVWLNQNRTGGAAPQCGYNQTSGNNGAFDFANLFFHN